MLGVLDVYAKSWAAEMLGSQIATSNVNFYMNDGFHVHILGFQLPTMYVLRCLLGLYSCRCWVWGSGEKMEMVYTH